MLLTGEAIDADSALCAGLVSRVVPPEQLMETAFKIATRVAANAPLAIVRTLELIRKSRSLSLADSLDMERASLQYLLASMDAKEGIAAFSEKRAPTFTGH